MLNTKAAEDFVAPLLPLAASVQAVAIPGEANSLSAERPAGPRARASCRAPRWLRGARQHAAAGPPARVLIAGSLYLAGRVLAENG